MQKDEMFYGDAVEKIPPKYINNVLKVIMNKCQSCTDCPFCYESSCLFKRNPKSWEYYIKEVDYKYKLQRR